MHHLLNTLSLLEHASQLAPTCPNVFHYNRLEPNTAATHVATLQLQLAKAGANHTAAKWNCPAGTHAVELFLLLSACRNRDRAGLYTFQNESEMLTWLAVFNKAVAAVVVAEGYQHMQLHDYHGALDVMIVLCELCNQQHDANALACCNLITASCSCHSGTLMALLACLPNAYAATCCIVL